MPQQSPQHATDPGIASAEDTLIDAVTASQQEALETMEVASHAVFEGLSKVQREVADFVAERIRQDMETQQELLRCRTLDDVRKVQAHFFQTAFDQYSAETTRLMKLGGDVAARSFERSRH
jgi:phasin protein